jgi:GIY-YIG catalytic domain
MNREHIMYTLGEFVYVEFISGERLRYKPLPNKCAQYLEKASSTYVMTEDELNWIRDVFTDNFSSNIHMKPSYYYKMKIEYDRNNDKELYRIDLDNIRKVMPKFSPQELLTNKSNMVNNFNFSGIYIIHNRVRDMYYVGQAKNVYVRAIKHFQKDKGNPDIYQDSLYGDEFTISFIPLEKTSFSSLNDLEDIAIRAYDSFGLGYNKMPGIILDKPIFKNDNYRKVAELIINKIKDTEWFLRLSNKKERLRYTSILLSEHKLPRDIHFITTFPKMIKQYQNTIKRETKI